MRHALTRAHAQVAGDGGGRKMGNTDDRYHRDDWRHRSNGNWWWRWNRDGKRGRYDHDDHHYDHHEGSGR